MMTGMNKGHHVILFLTQLCHMTTVMTQGHANYYTYYDPWVAYGDWDKSGASIIPTLTHGCHMTTGMTQSH